MPKRVWTMDRVLEEVRGLSEAGADLRHGSVQQRDKKLVSAAIRYFGSWRAAVVAAGVDYEKLRESSVAERLQKIGKWSCERIVGEVRALQERGEDLRAVMIKNKYPALFSAAVSSKYFGSWREALTKAGIDYESVLAGSPRGRPKRGEIWHGSLILEKLREMKEAGMCLDAEYASAHYPRLMRLATRRFGSWHAACKEAFEPEAV